MKVWAVDRGDGSEPFIPYPGSGKTGSREVAETACRSNRGLGWRAVELEARPVGREVTEEDPLRAYEQAVRQLSRASMLTSDRADATFSNRPATMDALLLADASAQVSIAASLRVIAEHLTTLAARS